MNGTMHPVKLVNALRIRNCIFTLVGARGQTIIK